MTQKEKKMCWVNMLLQVKWNSEERQGSQGSPNFKLKNNLVFNPVRGRSSFSASTSRQIPIESLESSRWLGSMSKKCLKKYARNLESGDIPEHITWRTRHLIWESRLKHKGLTLLQDDGICEEDFKKIFVNTACTWKSKSAESPPSTIVVKVNVIDGGGI